jgi:Matrixin
VMSRPLILAAMLLTLVTMGCSGAPSEGIIVIDSSLKLKEQSAFILAFDEWFEAIPELRRPIEISDREATVTRVEGPSPIEEEGVTILAKAFPHGSIRVWPDMIGSEEEFHATALHEVGHYLGILGHIEDGQIMYPHYEPTRPVCISQEDIDELCEQRGGCLYPTYPSCD